jgi:hypothetical protein
MEQAASDAKVVPGREIRRFRRVVTGHDADGQSIIIADETSPHIMPIMNQPNFAVTDFWKSFATPADNSARTAADPCGLPIQVAPPAGGSVFRVVQFPPDKDWAEKAAALGGTVAIDETAKSASKGGVVRHAHMHRTRSIDYAIVLSGEIWAVMDVGETKLVAGDVLIQRGTNHAWANRSDAPCVIAFVLIDALPLE